MAGHLKKTYTAWLYVYIFIATLMRVSQFGKRQLLKLKQEAGDF